jgi:predicted metal-dependent HD superfamily phosphohydrolase
MKNTNPVVKEASEYVFNLFKEKLSSEFVYHNYKHTLETVKGCKKLSEPYNLTSRDYEVLLLAAWFHDTGYIQSADNHEVVGADLMKTYLHDRYSIEDIKEIESLILSTMHHVQPNGTLQEILHDADFINLGTDQFNHRAELLRIEWERTQQKTYSELEWAEIQLKFLMNTTYKTEVAILKYDEQREANLVSQRKLIDKLSNKELKNQEKNKPKPVKEGRGIETLYRSIYSYHINLTSIADNKAQIMININTLIISIIIALFGTGFTFSARDGGIESIRFVFPMAFLLLSSLAAVVFAILSARPNVTVKEKYDFTNKQSSLLYFGNFAQLQISEFVEHIKNLKQENQDLYDNMSVDIYHLGSVLVKKYRLLTWSYNIFMVGLVVCAIGFIVIMLFSYF